MPKIIVRYLPQFHRVDENDQWWGEGFTDWVTIQKSHPWFPHHQQPRIPLHRNYYDLLQKDTMFWQADLAKQYDIDGFAFYHYWFKHGKQILEKPAENLLRWTEIPMPFCFCWANETWARTWSQLRNKNDWAPSFDTKQPHDIPSDDDGILLEQKYGTKEDWYQHISYLIPFFQDQRYIKKEGKPVFLIYKAKEIHCLPDMIACWNSILQKHGFDGIYLIGETFPEYIPDIHEVDAWLVRCLKMPQLSEMCRKNGVKIYHYKENWKFIFDMMQNAPLNKPVYFCPTVDFDDTPRRGKRGMAFDGATVEAFHHYFFDFMRRNIELNNEYIFVNAWNEWGECAYLEPDEANGYAYLETIRSVKEECGHLSPTHSGIEEKKSPATAAYSEFYRYSMERMGKKYDVAIRGMRLLEHWMALCKRGIHIADDLLQKGYDVVGIYGLGYLGRTLLQELQGFSVKVLYLIDRVAENDLQGIPILPLEPTLPKVDAIIVTPAGQYSEIRYTIHRVVDYPTLSLEHILFEL